MNPITNLFVNLLFSLSILFSDKIEILFFHFLLILIIFVIKKKKWSQWKNKTKPYWIFLPITGVILFLISLCFSGQDPLTIFFNVILSLFRMYGTISIMTLYIIDSGYYRIIPAIRSLWYSSKLDFHWIDRVIVFFELSIRFFPTVKEQWIVSERSHRALSFNNNNTKPINKIIQSAKMLPDFILLNLHNTDRIVENMRMRGYGKIARRSIYPFIIFSYIDVLIFISSILIVIGLHNLG